MASVAQIEANRLNARKSTGPTSVEGKERSRFNALKHGADAQSRIIPGEDPAERVALASGYYDEFQPATAREIELVEILIDSAWETRRVAVLEAALVAALVARQKASDNALGDAILADASGPNALQKLFRRKQAARRDWFRASAELRRLHDSGRNEPNPAPAADPPQPEIAASPAPPAAVVMATVPASELNFTQKNPRPPVHLFRAGEEPDLP